MDQSGAQAAQARDNEIFPYQILARDQIRLLTVHLIENESFRLSLEHYPYDTALKYDALSYAWNPLDAANGPPKIQVLCNATSFEMSSNLYQAIKSLAKLGLCRPIWIDYICINQNNIKEKEWQLPLMGQYYSRAKMVWIWLGLSNSNSDLAMKAMARLALELPTLRVSLPVTDAWLREKKLPLENDGLWDGIDHIYTREWFNRLWTMQEFVLAVQTIFVCGLEVATGAEVVTVAQESVRLGLVALSRRGRIPHVGYKDGYHFPTFNSRYREAIDDHGSISLHLALQLARFKEAKGSQKHDRVYALLGLLHTDVIEQIPVDYDLPWWKMYVEVGKVSLKVSDHLDLLMQCQSTWRHKDLPSWCPNFSAENEAAPFIYECYFAGYVWGRPCSPHIEVSTEDQSHLLVEGVSFTMVVSVAKHPERGNTDESTLERRSWNFQDTFKCMDEFLEMARKDIPESYFQPVPEAFLRTLVADVLEGHKTGHSYERLKTMWACTQAWISCMRRDGDTSSLDAETQNTAHTFLDSVLHVCRFRRFFVAADDRLALGPDQVQTGDQILIIKDAHMPFVIREHGRSGVYKMLGPAYVRGLMMGQVPKMVAAGELQWKKFEIA
jgi:hypothetical protein